VFQRADRIGYKFSAFYHESALPFNSDDSSILYYITEDSGILFLRKFFDFTSRESISWLLHNILPETVREADTGLEYFLRDNS